MTARDECGRQAPSPERVRAWVMVGLTPLGIALAVVAFVVMLSATGAVSFPSDRFGAAFDPLRTALSLFVAGSVALAAPSLAIVWSSSAVRRGDARAQRAVTASWVAWALAFVVAGAFGLPVWGPVLWVALRHGTSGAGSAR